MSERAAVLPGAMDSEESVNLTSTKSFFEQCEANRELLQNVYVVVPVRPQDGINCVLHRHLAIWYGEGVAFADLNDHMGGFIENTRANIAYTFKTDPPINPSGKPCEYLLMIDNDMEPPLELPLLLARHRESVVAAPAMSIDKDHGPQLCFTVEDLDGSTRFPCYESGQKIPEKGLKAVHHIGTGAMLIRRDVIDSFTFTVKCTGCDHEFDPADLGEELGELCESLVCPTCNTFKNVVQDIPFVIPLGVRIRGALTGMLTLGDDLHFCNQVRKKGFGVYVDLEAHTGHRKSLAMIWDDAYKDPLLDAEKWKVPKIGKVIQSR